MLKYVVLSSVAFVAFAGCASTSRELSQGDGVVSAPTGVHRFEMQFDRINLATPGSYTFSAANIPAADMHALLALQAAGEPTAQALDEAGVSVRMTLRGDPGGLDADMYQVRDGLLEGEWARTHESWNAEPLEYVGTHFKPRRHEQFIITLDVSVRGQLPAVELWAVPMIRGGAPLTQATAGGVGGQAAAQAGAGE